MAIVKHLVWATALTVASACATTVARNPDADRASTVCVPGIYERYTSAVLARCSAFIDSLKPGDPARVFALEMRGWLYEKSDNTAAAEQDYRLVLRLDPMRSSVRSNLAVLLAKDGNLDEAGALLDANLRDHPSMIHIYAPSTPCSIDQDQFWPDVRMVKPGLVDALLYHAGYYIFQEDHLAEFSGRKDYRAALAELERAHALAPDDVRVKVFRGAALRRSGNNERALEDFNAALAATPGLVTAHCERALILQSAKRYAAAVDDYDRIIALRQKDRFAYVGRADVYVAMGKFTEAIADCSKLIAQGSDYPEVYLIRGRAWRALGKDYRAEADFGAAADRLGGDLTGYIERGALYAAQGKLQMAIADFTAVIHFWPRNIEALSGRADAYLRLGRFTDALQDYDQVLALNPKQASSLYGRGRVKLRLGDAVGGNADIAAALTLQPDVGDKYLQWGVAP